MGNNINPNEDNKVFKIREDGTLVRESGEEKPKKKKITEWFRLLYQQKYAKWLWLLLGILILIIIIIARDCSHKNYEIEYSTRQIEQAVYELQGRDGVFWTTRGTNTNLHLYNNCPKFSGMPIESGNTIDAVRYFYNVRNLRDFKHYNICSDCKSRSRNNK